MNASPDLQSTGSQWLEWRHGVPFQPQVSPQLPAFRQYGELVGGLEQQMAEFAAKHEAVLKDLRKHYVLPADASVWEFLSDHRTIPQILLEAVFPLATHFGSSAVFNLRAPIDESGSRTLYVVAMWPGKLRDVLDALARFDSVWWMPRAGQAGGRLTFTYELV